MTTTADTDSITAKLNAKIESFATREAWLAARRTYGIGSSDVPAILGISRFQSALALYHEKKGLKAPSPGAEEQRRWGQILEEPIAQRFALETKRVVYNPNDGDFKILRRTDKPFMIASVDRIQAADPIAASGLGMLVGDGVKLGPAGGFGVLEVKNAHLMMRDEWVGEKANNQPPVEYQVQLQHQLAVTGALWGSIAALIGGVIFLWADLPRDQELIDRLIEMEGEFMRRLELSDPPAADGSESSREVLKKLYPKDNGQLITLPAESLEWHNALEAAKLAKKAAEADEALMSNLLKQAIGENTGGILPDGNIYTHKWQERAEFVSPKAEFRVLRLKSAGKRG
jgi:putative phage-type endonuclease